jgi:hypothetical protein
VAKRIVSVVFPTPPFALQIAMTLGTAASCLV